jgi:1,4-dihydroxy-2-naphthoyl-CoA hydrolase
LSAPDQSLQPAPDRAPPGFDALYGMEDLQTDGDRASARVRIDDRHLQPFGIVHGGVYAALAESVASMGTWEGTGRAKFVAGLSNVSNFLRPANAGDTLTATAVARHRGRTTWVWEVDVRDQHDRTCALVRVTIAVRELQPPR